MTRNRGIKAWLVTWEYLGDHAKPSERIAAIINSRRAAERVRETVEFLYVNATFSPAEKVLYAAGKHNPYPARYLTLDGVEFQGEIQCGNNPWLRARKVQDLRYQAEGRDERDLTWTDHTPEHIRQARDEIRRIRGAR